MKKYIWILLLVILAGILYINKNEENRADKSVVKIGAVFPITGKVANLGEGAKNAVSMAIEEVNSNPNNKYKYELIVEDDSLENKKTALAAQKLINIDKVNSIISFFSGAGLVINPLAEQNKIIHFGDTWHPRVADGYYNFIHFTQIEAQTDKYIELLKEKDIKRVAIFTTSRAGSVKNAETIRNKISNVDGIDVVFFDKFSRDEKSFTTLIEKAKASNPDYYYIQALSPSLEILVKQMHELGIENEKINTVACFDTSLYKDLFNGSYTVTIADSSKNYRKKYVEKYGIEPSYASGFAYDIVKLIVFGYENTKSDEGDVIPYNEDVVQTILQNKNFKSILGKVKIDSEGIVHSIPTLKKVIDGKIVLEESK
jgi:branched-chain amino acid transport system substrate-binding protein